MTTKTTNPLIDALRKVVGLPPRPATCCGYPNGAGEGAAEGQTQYSCCGAAPGAAGSGVEGTDGSDSTRNASPHSQKHTHGVRVPL